MSLKKKIQNNKFLYYGIKKIRYIQYCLYPKIRFTAEKYFIKYDDLKKYKNKHKGERCFIIATGPSLKLEDLRCLDNEFTIGMNSISKINEKTKWEPTYYGIQDELVFTKLKKSILKLNDNIPIFCAKTLNLKNDKMFCNKKIVEFPIDVNDHLVNPNSKKIDFSNQCEIVVYDGYTITYSLIQIAIYMGFNEIYLLGADCNYNSNGNHHFIETGVIDPNLQFATERMIYAYQNAKYYADSNNIKIYNATRGGKLEVFERKVFDEIKFKK